MKHLCSVVLSFLFNAGALHAQLTLEWSTADSGGGTSSGGAYSVSGTFAQSDASPPAAGGGFSLEGGYWTFPPDELALPEMTIALDNGVVLLTWADPGFAVLLETSSDLSIWAPVDPPPAGNYYYDFESARRFYRLRSEP